MQLVMDEKGRFWRDRGLRDCGELGRPPAKNPISQNFMASPIQTLPSTPHSPPCPPPLSRCARRPAMGKRKRDHDPQNPLTNGSGVHVAKKPSSRTRSPPFQQTFTKPEVIQGNAHSPNKLLSPVVLQVVTGTYEKILHGFSATISALPKDEKQPAGVEFSDTFMFKAHDSSIRCLAISPSARASEKVILASGGSDQVINLYSLSTTSFPLNSAHSLSKPSLTGNEIRENAQNKEVGSLQHHVGAVNTLVFPTRSKLLSAADDNTIGVTRTRDWTVLSTIKAPVPKAPGRPSGDTAPSGVGPAGVNGLAIHPSMKLMLSVGKGEKCMRLWNLVTGKKAGVLNFERDLLQRVGETKHSSGEGRNIAWNASGDEFAISFERGCVVYGIDSKVKGYIFPSPRTKIHQLAYMSSVSGTEQPRELLTLSTEDGRILLYSRISSGDNGDNVTTTPSPNQQIEPCAQLGESTAGLLGRVKDFEIVALPEYNCHCFVTGSSDGAIRFWSVNALELDPVSSRPSQERANNVISMGENPDRGSLVPHIGRLLGTYEGGNRITCLKVFRMNVGSVTKSNGSTPVKGYE